MKSKCILSSIERHGVEGRRFAPNEKGRRRALRRTKHPLRDGDGWRHHEDMKYPTFEEAFPGIPESERPEAEERLRAYLLLVVEVYRELALDDATWERFCALTDRDPARTMRPQPPPQLTNDSSA